MLDLIDFTARLTGAIIGKVPGFGRFAVDQILLAGIYAQGKELQQQKQAQLLIWKILFAPRNKHLGFYLSRAVFFGADRTHGKLPIRPR